MQVTDKTLAHRHIPKAYQRLYVDVWPPALTIHWHELRHRTPQVINCQRNLAFKILIEASVGQTDEKQAC